MTDTGDKHARTQPGPGRKSSKNRIKKIEPLLEKHTKTPLEYMLRVLNDENAPMTLRIEAAKAAAPSIHLRLPPVQVEEEKPGSNYSIDLTKLSDEELMQYERIWLKGHVRVDEVN